MKIKTNELVLLRRDISLIEKNLRKLEDTLNEWINYYKNHLIRRHKNET